MTFLTNQTVWKSVVNSVSNSTLRLWSTSYLHRRTYTPGSATPVPRWRRFRHAPPQSTRRLSIYVYGCHCPISVAARFAVWPVCACANVLPSCTATLLRQTSFRRCPYSGADFTLQSTETLDSTTLFFPFLCYQTTLITTNTELNNIH